MFFNRLQKTSRIFLRPAALTALATVNHPKSTVFSYGNTEANVSFLLVFQIFPFSAAPPEHPHAGPAALGCGSGPALRPLLRTPVPLMVALGFTLFRAPPQESPRGQPCGGGTPQRRCGSGKKRSQDKPVYPATDFFADFPLCYRFGEGASRAAGGTSRVSRYFWSGCYIANALGAER